jgi:hypothetical protein
VALKKTIDAGVVFSNPKGEVHAKKVTVPSTNLECVVLLEGSLQGANCTTKNFFVCEKL